MSPSTGLNGMARIAAAIEKLAEAIHRIADVWENK
jgi:hypothetical protein